jgi:hypothetical protein
MDGFQSDTHQMFMMAARLLDAPALSHLRQSHLKSTGSCRIEDLAPACTSNTRPSRARCCLVEPLCAF